jgi:LmbE family N-acetylglucosaminyl deacetylase
MVAPVDVLHELPNPERALKQVPLLFVVAHPDDEVLAAGSRLPRLPLAHIVYATDGAPRDLRDAQRLGFASQEDYADARRQEADRALAMLGIGPERVHRFGLTDQDVAQELPRLLQALAKLCAELRPAAIVTHAYEGGHPDHDAVALAVHILCRDQEGGDWPQLIEFAGYHDADGSGHMATQSFLPAPVSEVTLCLKPAERVRKRRVLDCFKTQRWVLRQFGTDRERFRRAPCYRFTVPPHPWPPYYERFVRHLDGKHWRSLAAATLAKYGLREPL